MMYRNPRCSMYGIFTYIWAIFWVNVGKYSIHGASGNDDVTSVIWCNMMWWWMIMVRTTKRTVTESRWRWWCGVTCAGHQLDRSTKTLPSQTIYWSKSFLCSAHICAHHNRNESYYSTIYICIVISSSNRQCCSERNGRPMEFVLLQSLQAVFSNGLSPGNWDN